MTASPLYMYILNRAQASVFHVIFLYIKIIKSSYLTCLELFEHCIFWIFWIPS